MQLIKVKYVGKADSILTEYDGIKYNFSKSKSVVIIPIEVWKYMQDYQNPYRDDVVPVTDAKEEKEAEAKKTMQQDVEDIEKDINMKGREDEAKKGRSKRK